MNPSFKNIDERAMDAAVFAAAATESSVVDVGGAAIVGLYLPVGVTTANITFKVSPQVGASEKWPDLPLVVLYNDAASPAIETLTGLVAGRMYKFGTDLTKRLSHLRNVQLVASAAQTGGSTIYLILARA